MFIFLVLLLGTCIPAINAADDCTDRKTLKQAGALLKNLITRIPAHPDHGSFAAASVKKTFIFLAQNSNEKSDALRDLKSIVNQDNRRILSPALIDDLIHKIQNNAVTKNRVRRQLARYALCIAERIRQNDLDLALNVHRLSGITSCYFRS